MRNARGCAGRTFVIAIWLVVAVLLIGVCLIAFSFQRQQEELRAQFELPSVLITAPAPGASTIAGSYLAVSATAFGRNPITRAELWLDGALKETRANDQPGDLSFDVAFDLLVTEGAHMIFVRAVNTLGMIGQSHPVSIVAARKPSQSLVAVRPNPGESLADLARTNNADVGTLQQLNPHWGGPGTPADAPVRVPAPAANDPATPSPPTFVPGSDAMPIPGTPPVPPADPPLVGVEIVLGFLATPVMRPPTAPTDLQAQVTNCKIRLRWNDHATNEAGYEVWIAGTSLSPRKFLSLKPAAAGAAWVEFAAPLPGHFSLWVEAVNLFGRQPSNIVWVSVDTQCPSTLPTQLQVEALDLAVGGGYDRVYCYISFENTPETRVPSSQSQFIAVQGGAGDIAQWAAGAKKIVLPIPADGALDLTGECWGWAGKTLSKLGNLGSTFPSPMWDGTRRQLDGGGFRIGFKIAALDTTGGGTRETYGYEDPSMPVPYNVREDMLRSISGDTDPRDRALSWTWNGDPQKITGFKIYLNGAPYNLGLLPGGLAVGANTRQVDVRLPVKCGKHIRWQVSAYVGDAESKLSAPFEYDLPKCAAYALVKFESINFTCTAEGSSNCKSGNHCDTLEVYYQVAANGKGQKYGSGQKPKKGNVYIPLLDDLFPDEPPVGVINISMKCGNQRFDELYYWITDLNKDTILAPINPDAVKIEVGADFWDYDDTSDDDLIALHRHVHLFANLAEAQKALVSGGFGSGCSGKSFTIGPSRTESGTSYLTYSIIVFPNQCGDTLPPGIGGP